MREKLEQANEQLTETQAEHEKMKLELAEAKKEPMSNVIV